MHTAELEDGAKCETMFTSDPFLWLNCYRMALMEDFTNKLGLCVNL